MKDCQGKCAPTIATCKAPRWRRRTSRASRRWRSRRYGAGRQGGFGLAPDRTESILRETATDTACPATNPFVYPGFLLSSTATCEGTQDNNGF